MEVELANHESHPEWRKLCEMCGEIERLQYKSKELRKKIDKEIFDEKWVRKQSNLKEGK